jgi:hypothetical protein
MNISKHFPWLLAGLMLLAVGCQNSATSANDKGGEPQSTAVEQSSATQQSSTTQHSSSSSQEVTPGTCTPIYIITPGDQPNQLVDYDDGIDYCVEVIRAEGCAGNFCHHNQDTYWTWDKNFKPATTTQSSSSSPDSTQVTCTPIYMITPADQPNQLVDYNDGIDYCVEVIRAEGCAGNFCLHNQDTLWTWDKDFKPTSTAAGDRQLRE